MPEIYHKFNIKTTKADRIFTALTTAEGLSKWWTEKVSVEGDLLTFWFTGGYHKKMKVMKQKPGKWVEWKCDEGDPQWIGTMISFEINPTENGGNDVHFRHTNWKKKDRIVRPLQLSLGFIHEKLKGFFRKRGGKSPYY